MKDNEEGFILYLVNFRWYVKGINIEGKPIIPDIMLKSNKGKEYLKRPLQ